MKGFENLPVERWVNERFSKNTVSCYAEFLAHVMAAENSNAIEKIHPLLKLLMFV